MTHTLEPVKVPLVELFWAQEELDYWLELGADPHELKKDINAEIATVAGDIHTYHHNTRVMLDEKLPLMTKWIKALEQINVIIDGPEELIIVDELWLRAKWGIYIDLEQGDYNGAHTHRVVPFLNGLRNVLGIIPVDELTQFLGNYWTTDESNEIIQEFYNGNPVELFQEMAVYHLSVNRVVLDEFFWASVNNATRLQELLYKAKEDGDDETIMILQQDMDKHQSIIAAIIDLEPEYQEQIIEDFFKPVQ